MKVLHVFTLATTAESFFDGQFKYLSENGHQIDLVCSENSLIEDFAKRNKIQYIPLTISRTLSPKEDARAVKFLYELIRRNHYDIVVGHTPKGALLSMIASRLAGVKNRVYLRHGLIYTTTTGIKRTILKTEEKFVSSLASHIINVSPSLSALAVKDHLNSATKQTVIGKGTCGGIDTIHQFNPTNIQPNRLNDLKCTKKISEDDYVIGFCGRLCKDKGIPELIEGFILLRQQHPEMCPKLLLVGGYDSRDLLPQGIIQKIESDNDIIHVGHILKDIQYYYALMDVFVFPSHREGFGMCAIEAQAMGIPALVAKSHGCVDTILHGISGEYIDLTPQDICKQLIKMHNSDKRKHIAQYARKFVTDNFERTKLWPNILEHYNNICFSNH